MQIVNVTSRLVKPVTVTRDGGFCGGFKTNEKVAMTNEQRQITCVGWSDATMRVLDSVKM